MNTFYLRHFGCKVNQYDAQVLREKLSASAEEVSAPENADSVYLYICSVTEKAGREPLKFASLILRDNKKAKIIFCGCIGKSERDKIVELSGESVGIADVSPDINCGITSFREHSRAFIKIQDGCDSFCAYCIVPYLRNKIGSKNPDMVINEIRALKAAGYSEFVLSGTHIGRYRPKTEMNLAGLVTRIEKEFPKIRLRLSSIEVNELTDELISVISGSKIFLPHLHIPLQSGSDDILRKMRRKYFAKDFIKTCKKALKGVPGLNLTSDVIAGFPSETQKDFNDTVSVCREIPFGWIHIFPFSERAEAGVDKSLARVPGPELKMRLSLLHETDIELRRKLVLSQKGKTLRALVEKKKGDSYSSTCDNYMKAVFNSEKNQVSGNTVSIQITGLESDSRNFPFALAELKH